MSEDGSIFIPLSTPNSLSEHPRDEQFIRSVPEHDEKFDRASLSTTNLPSEYYLVPAEVSAGKIVRRTVFGGACSN